MKRLSRLLLLVAFLLPLKGALATVGLFCHVDGTQPAAAMTSHQHDAAHHASQHGSTATHHDHSTGHDAPAQHDSCKYCAAVCAVPPLAPAELTLRQPAFDGGERFAAISAMPPGLYVSGLERPPRSI